MPDFDPDKFLAETRPSAGFDPDKFLAETAPKKAPENSHDLVPFLGKAVSGVGNLAYEGAKGLATAALEPGKTAQDVASSLASPDTEGAYRAIRNIPMAGPAIEKIGDSIGALKDLVMGQKPEDIDKGIAQEHQTLAATDAQHAKEHPLTDFIQRSVGSLPFAASQAPVMAADVFQKSLDAGNDTWTAMKDARNALVLSALAVQGGKMASNAVSKVAKAVPEAVGVSPEAMALNAENPSLVNAAIKEGPLPPRPVVDPDQYVPMSSGPSRAVSPIENLATPEQNALSQQFVAKNNPNKVFEKLGQKAGGAMSAGMGHVMGHTAAGLVGIPAGVAAGGYMGSLVDRFGAPAVKMVQDAGIALDKVANTPYIGVLMKAASEGNQALGVTHYLLGQTDPEYQKNVLSH